MKIEHYILCSFHDGGDCDFDCADFMPQKTREIIKASDEARAKADRGETTPFWSAERWDVV